MPEYIQSFLFKKLSYWICKLVCNKNNLFAIALNIEALNVICKVLEESYELLEEGCKVLGESCKVLGEACKVLGESCEVLGEACEALGEDYEVLREDCKGECESVANRSSVFASLSIMVDLCAKQSSQSH